MSRNLVFTCLLLTGGFSLPSGAEPFVLITSQEAARPDATATRAPRFREDGPKIQMKAPEHEGEYLTPMNLEVRFRPGEDGKAVDITSLKVSYVKFVKIDVTERLAEFIQADGIHVPEAAVPAGKHTFEIYIEDVADNPSYRRTTFRVEDAD